MRADKERQREPFSFGTDYMFPVESKRQFILTHRYKHTHQSGTYTATSLKEPFEALLDLSLPLCHPLSSHISSPPLPILAPAEMRITKRKTQRKGATGSRGLFFLTERAFQLPS